MFENDRVTCVAPWTSLRIDTNGNYRYCDHSKKSSQSDLLPSDWFNKGTEIVWARQSIQNGIALSGCYQCYYNEELKFDSLRQRKNLQAAIHHGEYFKESVIQSPVFKRMLQSEVAHNRPAFIHVSLSNLCNLSCRMCTPDSSSKLTSTYKKINLISKNTPNLIDWTMDESKWNDFLQNLVVDNNDLICLHFMGGEPLYHDKFYKLLNTCIEHKKTDFHITFVTNGTIWPSNLVEVLSKFKSATVEISVENFHETSNYIRHGSDFKVIQHNIIKILSTKTDNISVVLRTVPQALSVQHYDTLIDFALTHCLSIDSNMLFTPEELSISVLPHEVKERVIEKFKQKYFDLLSSDIEFTVQDIRNRSHLKQQMKNHIQKIIHMLSMPEQDNIEQLRSKFINYNRKFDQVTKCDFFTYYPDLKDFYEKYNRN
jgi:MoaA/NifB/PqqE/SkfB family radical SAM enzyme